MSATFDHVGLKVRDFERAREFYKATLGALGIKLLAEFEFGGTHHAGFGDDRAFFWISDTRDLVGKAHVAFVAASRSEVQAFHSIGLSMGGRDNGPPGIRGQYAPDYFGAFLFDPDGNNIEAVHRGPERES